MKTKQLLKVKLLFALFLLISISANAQDTLTNQGFNRWEKSGKQPPFDWSEPQGWTTSNPLTEFISAGVNEATIAQSGSSQAEVKTLNVFGQPIPGVLINGEFELKITDTGEFPLVGGEPMTTVKTKLYGMYNFTAVDTTDSAQIFVAFKKFNTNSQKTEAVAIGAITLPATSSGLFPFTILIDPITSDIPDSVAVTILSSKGRDLKLGGVLTVDYVSFDQPVSLPELNTRSKTLVYPSPASDKVFIRTEVKDFNYVVFDMTGRELLTGTSSSNSAELNVSHLKNGAYYIRTNVNDGEVLRFIKN